MSSLLIVLPGVGLVGEGQDALESGYSGGFADNSPISNRLPHFNHHVKF